MTVDRGWQALAWRRDLHASRNPDDIIASGIDYYVGLVRALLPPGGDHE